MKVLLVFVVYATLALNSAAAGTTDNDGVAAAFSQVCANCHGPTGRGMASYPKIAGKEAEYIASRLREYRAGNKVGPNSPLMIPHAANLSDAEIESFANYLATGLQ